MFAGVEARHRKPRHRLLAACSTVTVVLALLQASAALGQTKRQFIRHPELIEGPWEFSTPSGTYGLFITISTWWGDTVPIFPCPRGGCMLSPKVFERELARPRTITQQSVNISTFRPGPNPQYRFLDSTGFNGNHLTLNSLWGRLDVDFRREAEAWTGSLTYRESMHIVRIRRPRTPPGVKRNPFVGKWRGLPGANAPAAPTILHIVELSDGTITAWLDQKMGGFDCRTRSVEIYQNNGELLRVLSVAGNRIALQTTNPMGPPFRYTGRLSADGTEISGAWSSHRGEHFNSEDNFRRLRPSALSKSR